MAYLGSSAVSTTPPSQPPQLATDQNGKQIEFIAVLDMVDSVTNPTIATVLVNDVLPAQSGFYIPSNLGMKIAEAPDPPADPPQGTMYYNHQSTRKGGSFVTVNIATREITNVRGGVATSAPFDYSSLFQYIKHTGAYDSGRGFLNPGTIDKVQVVGNPNLSQKPQLAGGTTIYALTYPGAGYGTYEATIGDDTHTGFTLSTIANSNLWLHFVTFFYILHRDDVDPTTRTDVNKMIYSRSIVPASDHKYTPTFIGLGSHHKYDLYCCYEDLNGQFSPPLYLATTSSLSPNVTAVTSVISSFNGTNNISTVTFTLDSEGTNATPWLDKILIAPAQKSYYQKGNQVAPVVVEDQVYVQALDLTSTGTYTSVPVTLGIQNSIGDDAIVVAYLLKNGYVSPPTYLCDAKGASGTGPGAPGGTVPSPISFVASYPYIHRDSNSVVDAFISNIQFDLPNSQWQASWFDHMEVKMQAHGMPETGRNLDLRSSRTATSSTTGYTTFKCSTGTINPLGLPASVTDGSQLDYYIRYSDNQGVLTSWVLLGNAGAYPATGSGSAPTNIPTNVTPSFRSSRLPGTPYLVSTGPGTNVSTYSLTWELYMSDEGTNHSPWLASVCLFTTNVGGTPGAYVARNTASANVDGHYKITTDNLPNGSYYNWYVAYTDGHGGFSSYLQIPSATARRAKGTGGGNDYPQGMPSSYTPVMSTVNPTPSRLETNAPASGGTTYDCRVTYYLDKDSTLLNPWIKGIELMKRINGSSSTSWSLVNKDGPPGPNGNNDGFFQQTADSLGAGTSYDIGVRYVDFLDARSSVLYLTTTNPNALSLTAGSLPGMGTNTPPSPTSVGSIVGTGLNGGGTNIFTVDINLGYSGSPPAWLNQVQVVTTDGTSGQPQIQCVLDPRINATQTALVAVGAGKAWAIYLRNVDYQGVISSTYYVGTTPTGTIGNAGIGDGAITTTKISDGSISTPKIIAGAITAGTIAAGAIVAGKISAAAVTAGTIDANVVTAANIVSNTITAGQIAGGTITATELAASSIISSKISTDTLQAKHISVASPPIVAGGLIVPNPNSVGYGDHTAGGNIYIFNIVVPPDDNGYDFMFAWHLQATDAYPNITTSDGGNVVNYYFSTADIGSVAVTGHFTGSTTARTVTVTLSYTGGSSKKIHSDVYAHMGYVVVNMSCQNMGVYSGASGTRTYGGGGIIGRRPI